MTPAQAKNTIRRALRAVVDSEPRRAEITGLWAHFGSACAYCGRSLDRKDREGHIDHLVSGGANHISNRVLSCAPCNGDEKREGDWLEFLRKKSADESQFQNRQNRIRSWCAANKAAQGGVPDAVVQIEIDRVVSAFDIAVTNLRRLRQHVDKDA